MEDINAPLTQAERLAACELAIEAVAARLDWSRPAPEVTDQRLRMLLPPTEIAELERRRLRVQARVYQLLGFRG
jgi:hypothetical protein